MANKNISEKEVLDTYRKLKSQKKTAEALGISVGKVAQITRHNNYHNGVETAPGSKDKNGQEFLYNPIESLD